jgi:hypothetical protein
MRPFARQLDQLATIPGVGQCVAEVIIAETGADMARFPSAAHLASWAGVCPGQHESAGKRKSGKTRHGDRWLCGALGTAAMAAARTKDTTYLGARYHRLAPRLGKTKAIVAIQHSILTAVWHMLTDDIDYHDLGGDYFARLDPELNSRCGASCAKPTPWVSPSASTRSRPPEPQPGTATDHLGSRDSPFIFGPGTQARCAGPPWRRENGAVFVRDAVFTVMPSSS